MTDKLKLALAITFLLTWLSLGIWWTLAQWDECRDMGHSRFYCVGHVLK